MDEERKRTLERIFHAGLRAVDPEKAVRTHVRREANLLTVGGRGYDLDRYERVILVGAGKGAAPMAMALEDILGDRLSGGAIVVKYGHGLKLEKTRVIEAGHPVPDEAGLEGARVVLEQLLGSGEKDLVLCAFSGGGSALLPMPPPSVPFGQKQEATRLLLECGAEIAEINAIRKHLSLGKGGGLARVAYPSTVISLFLSDVVGDPLDVIASGPTVPDPTMFEECMDILRRYDMVQRTPERVLERIRRGMRGECEETPKPGDPVFDRVQNVIVGSNRAALIAAGDEATSLGYRVLILSSTIVGEAREVGRVLASVAREVRASGRPVPPPACILAGGETTVTIRGKGRGGRNQELALSVAMALEGLDGISALSAGTDGTDGPTDAAGAFAEGETCLRARAMNLSPAAHLAGNDSYPFFRSLGDLLITGPTRTNVMDMVCLLVD